MIIEPYQNKGNLLTFNEVDDIFYNFYENNELLPDGYYTKNLDAQPRQLLTKEEYFASGMDDVEAYYYKNKENFFSLFTYFYKKFTFCFIEFPFYYRDANEIKEQIKHITESFNETEKKFFFEGLKVFIDTKEKNDDTSFFRCFSVEILKIFLDITMREIWNPNFHFVSNNAYLLIEGGIDLNYRMLFNDEAKKIIKSIKLPQGLYIR